MVSCKIDKEFALSVSVVPRLTSKWNGLRPPLQLRGRLGHQVGIVFVSVL